jgi:hypothetical protein
LPNACWPCTTIRMSALSVLRVIAGHSASKTRVKRAYAPAIHPK